ncbi:MAG: hypothetical protein R2699_09165 [Acidimicrobiales bacterium]
MNAAHAASCGNVGGATVRFCARRSTGAASSSGSTSQPTRQPVIEKYLEQLCTTTASSLDAAAVRAGSPKVMPW